MDNSPPPSSSTASTVVIVIVFIVIAKVFIVIAIVMRLLKKKAAGNPRDICTYPVEQLANPRGNFFEVSIHPQTYATEKPANPIGNYLEMELIDLRSHTVEELNLEEGIGICTYTREELANATDNFTTKVGQGVSGFVYRANLPGNRVGAVKRATNLDPTLFKQELSVLLRLPRHPHLVDLIGLCLQAGERILVFEFTSKGSLYDRLHTERGLASPLSWPSRMEIACQVAVALQYLHEEARPPILHRDVKSANVLLVDDNCAKLADFGLSKLGPKDNQFTVTAVRGSYGYMDPQYMKTQRYSVKSDVYSFGVLLLELITGLKALHEDTPLAEWTQPYRFREDIDTFVTIVDRNLIDPITSMELQKMIQIANLCLRDITEERPSMRQIVNMMQNRTQCEINNASIS